MDLTDRSFNETQSLIEENRNNLKKRKYQKLSPVGYCQNCFEDVNEKQLFCNDMCAKQYEIASKVNFT